MLLRRYCDTDNDNADEDYVEIEKILAECRRDPGLYDASSRRFETHFLHMLIRKIVYIFLKKFLFFHNFQNPTHISNVKDRRLCVFVRYICIYSNITTYIRMCYIHHFVFIYPRLFGIHTRFTYRETNYDNTNNRRALL